MRCNFWQCVRQAMFVVGGLLVLPAGLALAVTGTVTFQTGVNGYTGLFDRKIDEMASTEVNGADVTQYTIDGYDANPVSRDSQVLMRFDNIIGNAAGQIPANATILSANLTVNTSTSGNAQSAGPFGIGQLLQAFDNSTSYFTSFPCGSCTLGSRGAWWQDGYTERPLSAYGSNWQGDVATADVREMVQNWVSGQANHGLVIQTGFGTATDQTNGTTDGWGINSSGHPQIEFRPQLSVTYTTDPIEVNTFQRGLNSYTGDTMAYVKSGLNIYGITGATPEPDSSVDDITHDGVTGAFTVSPTSTIAAPAPLADFQVFLDGQQFDVADTTGLAESADDFALIKFGGVFGNGANQAPTDVPVAKAWLAITTGDANNAAPSNGEWAVHTVLDSWDSTKLHSEFGDTPGLQASEGDIGPALDTQIGIIHGSEVWFDVTSYLENARTNPAADHGLAVLSTATSDGWQIHLNGSDQAEFRPRLVVASGNPTIVNPGVAGDFNGDGSVDAADYTVWRDNLGTNFNLNGNGNETGGSAGVVDQADYSLWKSGFGDTAGGPLGAGAGAVPEPSTGLLVVIAAAALAACGKRR